MDGALGGTFGSDLPTTPHFEVIKPDRARRKDLNVQEDTVGLKSQACKLSRKRVSHSLPVSRRSRGVSHDTRSDRTVFVGNIPIKCTRKSIMQLFKQYGSVESIRFRSIKVSPGDRPPRLAKRTQKQLVEGSSFNAYVVMSSSDEAESSLSLNGVVLQGRHLRLDIIAKQSEIDTRRSVFIGNLPFSADEEKLREIFVVCGEIESIRIVRDPKSGIGKGFGFVTFKDRNSVIFALKQNNKAVLDARTLRVYRSKNQDALLNQKQSKISGLKSVHANSDKDSMKKVTGKRRPDGTKNRYYRLPAS